MIQTPFGNAAPDASSAPTGDVLRAVGSALRGDRGGAAARLAKAQAGLERRGRQALRGAPAPRTATPAGPRPIPLPPLVPLRQVPLRLPDGRQVRLTLAPAVARYRDLVAVARVGDANAGRVFAELAKQRRAIDNLADSQRALADQLVRLQANGDLALLRGLIEGLARLEQRVETGQRRQGRELAAQRRALRVQSQRQARAVTAERRAAQVQKIQGAVASAQTAAFGVQGELLAAGNLKLALNQLGWGFASEFLTAIGVAKPGTVNPLVWLAPFGNLLTGQLLLGKTQTNRG